MSEWVQTTIDRRVGRIILDRPAALNALDGAMLQAIGHALDDWRDRPEIHAVVIQSAGKAFCAGGDIRAIQGAALAHQSETIEHYFAHEYALNLAIASYPKPFVALVDGVCMGGGIGVSAHGRALVATERAMLAMPETGIGLFPDVGATFFLPRLPGALGMFLGLTGHRLLGADAVHAGLATHYVTADALPALSDALARDGLAALAPATSALPPFSLAPHRHVIDHAFAAPTLADLHDRLRAAAPDTFAAETLTVLASRSPASLAWSFAVIRDGATRTLKQALAAELALTRGVTKHPDFAEGVRAMVIDKDRAPKWVAPDPATIDAILSATR